MFDRGRMVSKMVLNLTAVKFDHLTTFDRSAAVEFDNKGFILGCTLGRAMLVKGDTRLIENLSQASSDSTMLSSGSLQQSLAFHKRNQI